VNMVWTDKLHMMWGNSQLTEKGLNCVEIFYILLTVYLVVIVGK
jgi:hypothetical protein